MSTHSKTDCARVSPLLTKATKPPTLIPTSDSISFETFVSLLHTIARAAYQDKGSLRATRQLLYRMDSVTGTKTFQRTWVALVQKGKELGSGTGEVSTYKLAGFKVEDETRVEKPKPKESLQDTCAEMVRGSRKKRKSKGARPSRVGYWREEWEYDMVRCDISFSNDTSKLVDYCSAIVQVNEKGRTSPTRQTWGFVPKKGPHPHIGPAVDAATGRDYREGWYPRDRSSASSLSKQSVQDVSVFAAWSA